MARVYALLAGGRLGTLPPDGSVATDNGYAVAGIDRAVSAWGAALKTENRKPHSDWTFRKRRAWYGMHRVTTNADVRNRRKYKQRQSKSARRLSRDYLRPGAHPRGQASTYFRYLVDGVEDAGVSPRNARHLSHVDDWGD